MATSSPQVFLQELIVENILSFTDTCDWLINVPPLINTTFSQVFSSEKFAKMYLVNLFKLNDEQISLLEGMIQSTNSLCNKYQSLQAIFRVFVDNNLIPKKTLKNIVSQVCSSDNVKLMKKINEISLNATLALEIQEKLERDYYDGDLIIVDGNSTFEISNVSQFWKGGQVKKIFINSIKETQEIGRRQGGVDIEATVFMPFGYPLKFTFSGDYNFPKGSRSYFLEKVDVLETCILRAEDGYVEGTDEKTFEIMNNFIRVDQSQISSELNAERVYNTLCYHWYWPFFHGKSKMKEEFLEAMALDFDDPVIYTNSHIRPSPLKSVNKRKQSPTQVDSESKKNKYDDDEECFEEEEDDKQDEQEDDEQDEENDNENDEMKIRFQRQ